MITSTASTWHPSGNQSKGLMSVSTAGGQTTTDKGGVCFYLQAFFSCICMCMSVGMRHLQENTWSFLIGAIPLCSSKYMYFTV